MSSQERRKGRVKLRDVKNGIFSPWIVFLELLPAVGVGSVSPCFCALQVLQVASLSNETLEVTDEELHKLQGDITGGRDKGESWGSLPGGEVAELAPQQGFIGRKNGKMKLHLWPGSRNTPRKRKVCKEERPRAGSNIIHIKILFY